MAKHYQHQDEASYRSSLEHHLRRTSLYRCCVGLESEMKLRKVWSRSSGELQSRTCVVYHQPAQRKKEPERSASACRHRLVGRSRAFSCASCASTHCRWSRRRTCVEMRRASDGCASLESRSLDVQVECCCLLRRSRMQLGCLRSACSSPSALPLRPCGDLLRLASPRHWYHYHSAVMLDKLNLES